jgi:hypothetical protein
MSTSKNLYDLYVKNNSHQFLLFCQIERSRDFLISQIY